MADINEEVKVSGAFGGVEFEQAEPTEQAGVFRPVQNESNLPAKVSVWSKVKNFLFQVSFLYITKKNDPQRPFFI